ncbi:Zinc finger CCCH domain-containing protein, related [Eimeria tenella]|uniref:Zinc finger CCCH domain-containing protein, related n=1 Tax=Eimeria tenella TaxID=5802 RepID=U6L131_EIMTE|nr:Zinc finger CCCH domain-containing protein, related [Eimeria tenella]CDJ42304.1 Zinc finger CCCH domain-containing protein, related [Eimeria tenella]|eukprot:XP_013233054.1 Zinc finger CCCH domain-containing protein, related [Eimeria tenella]
MSSAWRSCAPHGNNDRSIANDCSIYSGDNRREAQVTVPRLAPQTLSLEELFQAVASASLTVPPQNQLRMNQNVREQNQQQKSQTQPRRMRNMSIEGVMQDSPANDLPRAPLDRVECPERVVEDRISSCNKSKKIEQQQLLQRPFPQCLPHQEQVQQKQQPPLQLQQRPPELDLTSHVGLSGQQKQHQKEQQSEQQQPAAPLPMQQQQILDAHTRAQLQLQLQLQLQQQQPAEEDRELKQQKQDSQLLVSGLPSLPPVPLTGTILADRRIIFYRTQMCPHAARGQCKLGSSCRFAHKREELRPPPRLDKTRICAFIKAGLRCARGPACSFAHSRDELRFTAAFFKTNICRSWMSGRCLHSDTCNHAHGIQELLFFRTLAVQTGARDFVKEKGRNEADAAAAADSATAAAAAAQRGADKHQHHQKHQQQQQLQQEQQELLVQGAEADWSNGNEVSGATALLQEETGYMQKNGKVLMQHQKQQQQPQQKQPQSQQLQPYHTLENLPKKLLEALQQSLQQHQLPADPLTKSFVQLVSSEPSQWHAAAVPATAAAAVASRATATTPACKGMETKRLKRGRGKTKKGTLRQRKEQQGVPRLPLSPVSMQRDRHPKTQQRQEQLEQQGQQGGEQTNPVAAALMRMLRAADETLVGPSDGEAIMAATKQQQQQQLLLLAQQHKINEDLLSQMSLHGEPRCGFKAGKEPHKVPSQVLPEYAFNEPAKGSPKAMVCPVGEGRYWDLESTDSTETVSSTTHTPGETSRVSSKEQLVADSREDWSDLNPSQPQLQQLQHRSCSGMLSPFDYADILTNVKELKQLRSGSAAAFDREGGRLSSLPCFARREDDSFKDLM